MIQYSSIIHNPLIMPGAYIFGKQKKNLKNIKSYLNKKGLQCEVLTTAKNSFRQIEKCFNLYQNSVPKTASLKVGDVVMDPEKFKIQIKNKKIVLSKKEFELFQFLILNKEKIISRQTILDNVWGTHYNPFTNTVDVHVSTLKKKIKSQDKLMLKTIHGTGYKFTLQ